MSNLSACVHEGLESLLRLQNTDRALVATVTNGDLVVQSIHSLQPAELDGSSPVTTVLAQVKKQPKAMLVLDSEQEGLLASLPTERRQEMRSAVCVPVLGEADKLLGILYADNRTKAGNFSYGDLNQLQAAAQELAPRLATELALQALNPGRRPKEEVAPVNTHVLAGIGALMVLGVLWFVVGAFLSRKPPPPAPPPVVARSGPPYVVSSFLGMLQGGDYTLIERLLSERMKKEWPTDRLTKTLAEWNSRHIADLRRRHVREGTGIATGFRADVVVDTDEPTQVFESRLDEKLESYRNIPRPRSPSNYWTFVLVKEADLWKIDSMQLAPPPPPNDPYQNQTPVPLPSKPGSLR